MRRRSEPGLQVPVEDADRQVSARVADEFGENRAIDHGPDRVASDFPVGRAESPVQVLRGGTAPAVSRTRDPDRGEPFLRRRTFAGEEVRSSIPVPDGA